jgi:hypothetical protein
MTVHWKIENRQYMLLRVFSRWKQAKREADKIERWYASRGIPVTVRLEGKNGQAQKTFANISAMSVLRDENNAEAHQA